MAFSSVTTIGTGSADSNVAASIDYAAAVNSSPAGIVVTDPTKPGNPIIFVNPAFVELTGYSAAESIGRNCRFLQGADSDKNVISEISMAVSTGNSIRKEILNYRKDGSTFWNDLVINPVMDETGRVASFVGIQTDITKRKQGEAILAERDAQIANIVKHGLGFLFTRVLKPDGTIRYSDSSAADVTWDAARTAFTVGNDKHVIHPDDVVSVREAVMRSKANLTPTTMEFRAIGVGGQYRWFRTVSTPRRGANGDIIWDGVGIDISAEKASESRLLGVVKNMPGYVFERVRAADGTISFPYVSPSYALMTGQTVSSTATTFDLLENVHPDDRERLRLGIERSAAEMSAMVCEYRIVARGGEVKWVRSHSSPRRGVDGGVTWDCVAVDISGERASTLRLAYLAHHDPLTGLANRVLLTERLAAAIKATRERSGEVALSHLMIIDFSEINETLGMDDGDAVLKNVAGRLSEFALLDRDTVVARVGNSEFALLRQGLKVGVKADEFVDVLMRNITQPILIGQESVAIEPCAGTATFGRGDLGHLSADAAAVEMLKQAAIAVSAAAKVGPGVHRLYDTELDHRTRHRMMLRHSMRGAIEQDEFELHYQPLVDLESGRIVSAEALIRWQHPELGMLQPDLFLSLAEESGLIGALGDWVMRRAMRQYSEWRSQGLSPPTIAINVSATQVAAPHFVETVRKALADTGVHAKLFELELTEGILVERSPETISALDELRLLGFQLVIDDFGAGHSNFQYLRNFPINKLKIDQVFVRQLVADSNDALIVNAIASLARRLKIGLVAEGIETVEQREFLRDQGCPVGQGYFFSLPLKAEDFAWMIQNDVVLPMISSHSGTRYVHGARR